MVTFILLTTPAGPSGIDTSATDSIGSGGAVEVVVGGMVVVVGGTVVVGASVVGGTVGVGATVVVVVGGGGGTRFGAPSCTGDCATPIAAATAAGSVAPAWFS